MPILPNNTLSTIVNLVNRANSDSVVQPPLSNAAFTLDSSGVAGFFGGESAVRAMGTAYLIPKRRWLGWYNAPGAYEVAKQYSGLAKSHLFNALFPAGDRDPAKILMVDGQIGPEYTPLYSPTGKAPSSIGHLGSLIAGKVSQIPVTKVLELGTKRTMDARVTFVNLRRTVPGEFIKLKLFPSSSIIFTVFTILISAGGCIACALVADWFCFASIALGIIANGVACSVIGSGKLYLKNNPSPQAASRGDILLKDDTNIIVLAGCEGMVRPFTHGRFVLLFGETPWIGQEKAQALNTTTEKIGDHKGHTPKHNPLGSIVSRSQRILQKCLTVDISVILLLFQFLAQLLLIPQGTLFGQLMFIGTLVPSWIYHSYLSTLGLDLQMQALFHALSIQESYDIFQYQLNTWTQAAVFACLVFRSINPPVWHSSQPKAHEQRREDALAVEAAKWQTQLENAKTKAEKMERAHANAEKEVEKAGREQEAADEEVQKAEAEAKVAGLDVEEAEEGVRAAEADARDAEADVEAAGLKVKAAEADVTAAEAKVKVADEGVGGEQRLKAEEQVKEAQDKKAEAENLVAKKKEEAKKKKEEVKKKQEEAQKKQEEAKKKEEELKKKMREATRKAAVKMGKISEAKAAKVAADKENKTKAEMFEEETNKTIEANDKADKKQEDEKMARQQEKIDKAFQALLDALLPSQTDVWRAFKESLVRKLSKANTKSSWAYTENNGTLEFNDEDAFTVGQDGTSKELDSKDVAQLHVYQEDAKTAFAA